MVSIINNTRFDKNASFIGCKRISDLVDYMRAEETWSLEQEACEMPY